MQRVFLGLLVGGSCLAALASSTNTTGLNKPSGHATWLSADFGNLMLCPENEVVVGMCGSGLTEACRVLGLTYAQKVKCLKVDENRYISTTDDTIKTRTLNERKAFFWHGLLKCQGSDMFMGGFCTSSDDRDCGEKRKFYSQVVCRSGYEREVEGAQTKDICGTFGDDIVCEEGWAAIGMCSGRGSTQNYCPTLRCARANSAATAITGFNVGKATTYGLRCAKMKTRVSSSFDETNE